MIVESPAKAKTIAGYLGHRLRRRVVDRPHPRPAEQRLGDPRQVQGRGLGAARRRRRQRLRAALRRRLAQEEGRLRPEGEAQGRRRAAARDGRGPRRRGDRLAPARGARPEGAGSAHGLPRDHAPGDRARARRDARHRRLPRRRAGDPPHPRPPVRLRGLAGALAQDHAGPLRGPGAVGGHAARRRARARADALRRRRLLGHRRDVRAGRVRRAPRRGRRAGGSRRAATSRQDGALRHADAVAARTKPTRATLAVGPRRASASRSPRSRRSRTRAARPRRS